VYLTGDVYSADHVCTGVVDTVVCVFCKPRQTESEVVLPPTPTIQDVCGGGRVECGRVPAQSLACA